MATRAGELDPRFHFEPESRGLHTGQQAECSSSKRFYKPRHSPSRRNTSIHAPSSNGFDSGQAKRCVRSRTQRLNDISMPRPLCLLEITEKRRRHGRNGFSTKIVASSSSCDGWSPMVVGLGNACDIRPVEFPQGTRSWVPEPGRRAVEVRLQRLWLGRFASLRRA
jgi:hypothetical protein